MKKEGTGKPRNPDIAIGAAVEMRELRFEKVPDPEVRFRGNTARNSVWKSRRANLPEASGYRLIQTLEELGAVVRDRRGRYRPGMLLVSLHLLSEFGVLA